MSKTDEDGLMKEFQDLIRLEGERQKLEDTKAFAKVKLVTYPEAWETPKPPKDGPKTLEEALKEMGPFDMDWAEFDLKFADKWHLIVKENTKPLPAEYDNPEGVRDLFGPEENIDELKDIPAVYCKKKIETRLPRKPKQRLPFPVRSLPEEPSLQVTPKMLEPFPPTIDWEKQHYKPICGDWIKPMYIRWEEYPEYDDDEPIGKKQCPPTLKEVVTEHVMQMNARKGKRNMGLLKIKDPVEPMTKEELDDFIEEKEKDEQFRNLLYGDRPDHWWQKRQDEELRDYRDFEIVGAKKRLERDPDKADYSKIENPFMELELPVIEDDEDRGRGRGRGRGGFSRGRGRGKHRGKWEEYTREEDAIWGESNRDNVQDRRRGGGRGYYGSSRDTTDSWRTRGAGASGWNRGKLPSYSGRGAQEDMDTFEPAEDPPDQPE
ncbi:uncharacterized protein LOC129000270 [Macrosteles quadrilineatus]|uniref:uncharacterized protein LOC129000270 n=1 Tax=Macrosteles quadrilineatus TaxID=74068 RepID=UPI0023E185B5|nr:uncharacterized protein LOC129000270 [Macrosteles quadrilineatus]